ncbi:hypothetical protein ACI3L1_14060 [Deinococcus sp. SM5_A1]|uniref:hypothetical protein n=1 Tax=Deinococcus sp. SM5_A1 TaxID=3379094 RepID=UPI00385C9F36
METRDYIALISAVLALTALYLNNYYANQRERRKEFRGRLDKINSYIEDMREIAFSFFTQDYSLKDSEKILYSFETLYRMIQSTHHFSNDESISGSFTNYKRAVTLNNFDKSSFSIQREDADILKEIYYSSESLIERLEEIYSRKFPLGVRPFASRILGH